MIPGEVEQGEIEFEFLNGIDLGDTEHGEERSVHEIAIGYGITDYWKLTGAFEIANPEGESALNSLDVPVPSNIWLHSPGGSLRAELQLGEMISIKYPSRPHRRLPLARDTQWLKAAVM